MNTSTSEYNSGYGKRPVWQWVLLYVVIGGAVYGLIYYFVLAKKGGYQLNQTTYPSVQPQETNQPVSASSASSSTTSAAMQITVDGSEFAFNPSTITVKKGQPVQLTFKNTGKYPHNLTITDLNIQTKTIQPGENEVISFTPETVGNFPFSCTVPGHAGKGMKGTLTVE